MRKKLILAIVGMPGAGKTEVAKLLRKKGFPFVRFGEETDRALKEAGLPLTEENERAYRERLRAKFGMAAYATAAMPRIRKQLLANDTVVLDGLYSWEEYMYLRKYFEELRLVCIFARPSIRYDRLAKRAMRPLSLDGARQRDIDEIEKLSKGGPIAIADYFIDNNGTRIELAKRIEALLQRLGLA